MIRKFASFLLVAAALGGASSLHAQITLENFSSFQSPKTLFFGGWSNSGDPFFTFTGELAPVSTFSQSAGGSYNFASGTNADTAYAERTFNSTINLGTNNRLNLSLRLLGDNTADSVTVFLIDSSANTAFATFQASDFTTAGFTTKSLVFTATVPGSFDASAVSGFRISGNDPFAGGIFSAAIDDLSATGGTVTPPLTAVPEPSTYGLMGALALIALIGARRKK